MYLPSNLLADYSTPGQELLMSLDRLWIGTTVWMARFQGPLDSVYTSTLPKQWDTMLKANLELAKTGHVVKLSRTLSSDADFVFIDSETEKALMIMGYRYMPLIECCENFVAVINSQINNQYSILVGFHSDEPILLCAAMAWSQTQYGKLNAP